MRAIGIVILCEVGGSAVTETARLCQEDTVINRFSSAGAAALAAAVLLTVGAFGASTANAGLNCVIGTPTVGTDSVPEAAVAQVAPTCTPTQPAQIRSATPTQTATPKATDTVEPSATVAASTSTPVPPAPSATKAGGGVGAGIQGPNTGTGGGTSGGLSVWLEGAIALVVIGGGTLAYGLRRRSA
jgi:hypothetical protein